jgi:hypothetical protein
VDPIDLDLENIDLGTWLALIGPWVMIAGLLVAWIYRRTLRVIDGKATAESVGLLRTQVERAQTELGELRAQVAELHGRLDR